MNDAFDNARDEFVSAPSLLSDEGISAPGESLCLPEDAIGTPAPQAAPAAPNGFVQMGLADELVRAVADMGFEQPTGVQAKCIPLALGNTNAAEGDAGRYTDLMVSSQTGSGKTAAFLLPVLHTLIRQQMEAEAAERAAFEQACADAAAKGEAPPKRPRRKDPTSSRNFKAATPGALVLCPTRELAQQVAHDAIDLVRHCRGLRIANVVGGMPYQMQIARLQNADLVVATPGRLLDLQRSMQIKLDQVQFLVVDEADRMLDLGFSDDLAEVNQLTIGRRQTMMFSATFAPRIQQLAARVMRQPQRVQIDSPQEKHQNIKQVLFWADNAQHKRKLLDHWLRDTSIQQAIVFASTQIECDGLANDLQQDGFSAVALHGALSQGLRNRRLMALRTGHVQILVATDVAARGIDVPSISHVFNFGLPMKAEDYTHRIGRTGRAGRDGIAVTLAEFRDRRRIMDIEAYTQQRFKSEVVPGLEPQQRMPEHRPSGFGPRGQGRGGFGGPRDGGREARRFGPAAGGPRDGGGAGYGKLRDGFGPQRDGFGAASGFHDRAAGAPRGRDGEYHARTHGGHAGHGAPRADFAPRADAHARPRPASAYAGADRPARSAPGGKVFVPRDAHKPRSAPRSKAPRD